jgi:hypothetical protein
MYMYVAKGAIERDSGAFLQTLHGVRAERRRVLAEEQRASELRHGAARSSSGGWLRDERARDRARLGCGVARSSLVGEGEEEARGAERRRSSAVSPSRVPASRSTSKRGGAARAGSSLGQGDDRENSVGKEPTAAEH